MKLFSANADLPLNKGEENIIIGAPLSRERMLGAGLSRVRSNE
jgi:hypothetical protein